jgi:hypothetical protein
MTGPSASRNAGDEHLADPHAKVGHFVRRRDDRMPRRFTPWAQIAMTVPSVSGLCWLVCFIDGEVDVWRVDDTEAHYQFRCRAEPLDGERS